MPRAPFHEPAAAEAPQHRHQTDRPGRRTPQVCCRCKTSKRLALRGAGFGWGGGRHLPLDLGQSLGIGVGSGASVDRHARRMKNPGAKFSPNLQLTLLNHFPSQENWAWWVKKAEGGERWARHGDARGPSRCGTACSPRGKFREVHQSGRGRCIGSGAWAGWKVGFPRCPGLDDFRAKGAARPGGSGGRGRGGIRRP